MNVYSSNELFDYLIVKKSTTKLEGPIPRQQKPINRPLGRLLGFYPRSSIKKEIGGLYPLSLSHTHRTNASVIDLGKPYTQKGTPHRYRTIPIWNLCPIFVAVVRLIWPFYYATQKFVTTYKSGISMSLWLSSSLCHHKYHAVGETWFWVQLQIALYQEAWGIRTYRVPSIIFIWHLCLRTNRERSDLFRTNTLSYQMFFNAWEKGNIKKGTSKKSENTKI